MSFKSFQAINSWVKDHFFPAQLEALWQLLGQLRMNVQAVNMVAERYGSVYSTVEQTSYDSQGTASDVTSAERQTVPESVVAGQIQQLKNLQATTDNLAARATGSMSFTFSGTDAFSWYQESTLEALLAVDNVNVTGSGFTIIVDTSPASAKWVISSGKLMHKEESGQPAVCIANDAPHTFYRYKLGVTKSSTIWLLVPVQGRTNLTPYVVQVNLNGQCNVYFLDSQVSGSLITCGCIIRNDYKVAAFASILEALAFMYGVGSVSSLTIFTWGNSVNYALSPEVILAEFTTPLGTWSAPATVDVSQVQSITELSLNQLIQDLSQL